MLIGYARISKADGSQSLDLQRDALREDGKSTPIALSTCRAAASTDAYDAQTKEYEVFVEAFNSLAVDLNELFR